MPATVWGIGDRSSGIPRGWAAGDGTPGVWLTGADRDLLRRVEGSGPRIVSIHWGENWGYAIPARQQNLARALIDRTGVSIVHGHSSHHPRGMEIYNGGLILYGAGDFINDYEGIGGHERYRPDLTAGYFVDVDEARAHVTRVLAVPFRLRRFHLQRASAADTEWLAETLEAASPAGGVSCRAVNGPAIDCTEV
jgi:poly-gamma-glutamate synthesis protein (capsule biosynthesis protein)